jgi:hypothetical protein
VTRRNYSIVAVGLFVAAALLNFDSDNAERRKGLYERARSIHQSIVVDANQLETSPPAEAAVLKSRMQTRIDEYNRLVEQFNRSRRGVFFGRRDQPDAMDNY